MLPITAFYSQAQEQHCLTFVKGVEHNKVSEIKFVTGAQGGLADVEGDRGGLTNFGITHATFDKAQAKGIIDQGKSVSAVKDIA